MTIISTAFDEKDLPSEIFDPIEIEESTWLYELRTAARQLCFVAMAVSEKSFELHEWLATKLDK